MKKQNQAIDSISICITVFIALVCAFPTIRLLLIGSQPMNNLYETVITSLPDVLILGTLIYVVFLFFGGKLPPIKFIFFDYILLLYFITNVIYGFYLSKIHYTSILSFRITYFPMLFYFVARFFEKKTAESLLKNLFTCFSVLAVIGLILYFIFPSFQNKMTTDTGYEIPTYFITRMSSLLLTPVLFGTIMALSCTYYYYKISYYEFYWFNYVTFILLFLCLLLSVSRGALISFLAASAFISVSVVHRKVKLIGGLIFTMLIVLVFTSFYATNSLKLVQWICHSSVETANMQAGVTRVNRWQVSLLDFKNQPQGYGFGKTGAVAYRYFINSPSIPAARYTTDGWYLKTACETGVYGLLSYLILAGTFLFYTLKKVIKNKSPNLIFTLGIFFVINIQNIASNTLDFYPYIIVYWLIIGFSINERSVVVAND